MRSALLSSPSHTTTSDATTEGEGQVENEKQRKTREDESSALLILSPLHCCLLLSLFLFCSVCLFVSLHDSPTASLLSVSPYYLHLCLLNLLCSFCLFLVLCFVSLSVGSQGRSPALGSLLRGTGAPHRGGKWPQRHNVKSEEREEIGS